MSRQLRVAVHVTRTPLGPSRRVTFAPTARPRSSPAQSRAFIRAIASPQMRRNVATLEQRAVAS